jgi:lipopolysaccharide export system protein LptA
MKVIYDEARGKNNKRSIKRIDAKGNVKIFSEEFIASGNNGYYLPNKDLFVLEENVIVNNGTSIASGNKFIYNLITKRGRFIGQNHETSIAGNGGDKRVVVIIGEDIDDKKDKKRQK